MPDEDSRQKLLDAAVAHVAAHGWGDLSLRRLATALGTSHRMLLYHFGSKEGLLSAVVGEVEAQQRAAMAELEPQPGEAPADVGWRFWERLTDPELAPLERLFFEMVGQALQGRPGTEGLLANLVEPWVEPVIDAAERVGLPPEAAAADVRLYLATARGLLLDLLATGDRAAVDAAMRRFSDLLLADPSPAPP
ncbi:MAG TPA: TetR/AcrR family transcriptional regulator [Acidimicrobiales bacterium]|nr:TetR/AcrR family transcriptional regulator [Acidimicrobiales bacterium]